MKVKEMNIILKDKQSQDLNCNFKIAGKGKSKFDLILQRLDQIDDFILEQREFNKKQLEFNKMVMSKLDSLETRLDNLVSKNNLKE